MYQLLGSTPCLRVLLCALIGRHPRCHVLGAWFFDFRFFLGSFDNPHNAEPENVMGSTRFIPIAGSGPAQFRAVAPASTSVDAELTGARAAGICPILIRRDRPNGDLTAHDYVANPGTSQIESERPPPAEDIETISKLPMLLDILQ